MRIPYIYIFLSLLFFSACQQQKGDYVCQPCDLPCDDLTFAKAGICPHCNMPLIHKSEIIDESELMVNDVKTNEGSGLFLMEGGEGKKEKIIKVYYHKPENYSPHSKILMVIPGAGRNGDSYRDAWIEASEKYGVLILSLMYPEEDYPFEDYHLGGVIRNPTLSTAISFKENSNVAMLNEEAFSFEVNEQASTWLFNDFDRIFKAVKDAIGSEQNQYDIFGHSAGGQILHRMALFYPKSKANRIVAANSGFYTLADFDLSLPFGLKDTPLSNLDLSTAFDKKLIVLLGELDNADEKGGTLLRSPTVDQQGLHRLERGQYFYNFTKVLAAKKEIPFNWALHIVPNVGHNHREMAEAATQLLYGEEK